MGEQAGDRVGRPLRALTDLQAPTLEAMAEQMRRPVGRASFEEAPDHKVDNLSRISR